MSRKTISFESPVESIRKLRIRKFPYGITETVEKVWFNGTDGYALTERGAIYSFNRFYKACVYRPRNRGFYEARRILRAMISLGVISEDDFTKHFEWYDKEVNKAERQRIASRVERELNELKIPIPARLKKILAGKN